MFAMFDALTARHFLTDGREMEGAIRPLPLLLPLSGNSLALEQEQMRVLLISSPGWVRETIHDLHRPSFAHANDWSGLLPSANPG